MRAARDDAKAAMAMADSPERYEAFQDAVDRFYAAAADVHRVTQRGRTAKPLRVAYRQRQLARRRRRRSR